MLNKIPCQQRAIVILHQKKHVVHNNSRLNKDIYLQSQIVGIYWRIVVLNFWWSFWMRPYRRSLVCRQKWSISTKFWSCKIKSIAMWALLWYKLLSHSGVMKSTVLLLHLSFFYLSRRSTLILISLTQVLSRDSTFKILLKMSQNMLKFLILQRKR